MAEQDNVKHTDATYFIRRVDEDDEGVIVDAWGREVQGARITESGEVTTDEADDAGGEDSTYIDWTNQQLTDEIKRRRDAGRDIHLDGRTKADAIAALEKDDAEAAQSEG